MKNLAFLVWLCQAAAAFLCAAALFAESPVPAAETDQPLVEWSLTWRGSWEKTSSVLMNRTFHNQGEIEIKFLQLDLLLRGQILDRRTFSFNLDDPWSSDAWNNPIREITNFTGGLYHTATGSRILFGVIDEWGLPARIRNPWIRSAPYAENHRAAIADLRTEASSTRTDMAYLYLSSPLLFITPNLNLLCFGSVQTEAQTMSADGIAFSGGIDLIFNKNTNLLLEMFYTAKTLPPAKISTWFSGPSSMPPLPEREFNLYAAGLLFKSRYFSASSDFALSETFAWGTDIYANLGITFSLRPYFISFAADGAGPRFVYRDGTSNREGFRSAAKFEWRGKRSSIFRIDTVLRANAFGENFNRGSIGLYYRTPAAARGNDNILRLTRISLSADRNEENPLKINDSFSGTLGLGLNLQQIGFPNLLRLNISGSIKGVTPPDELWSWNSSAVSCELILPYRKFQARFKTVYTLMVENDEKWAFSVNISQNFDKGRLSMGVESADFPDKWTWNISWRMEIQ